ncbi:MurR/RpiR family transcriptional regulator [Streptomyces chiangmaiensis]|uniref:MurR/RpiR family transcriptional regulator n=1 Tax=Streptomyces chiangmaiensis TaxID=766497 RepID=A0ABU7FBL1_9ACTN|nr:MurR/RpiR family transcriptional regulator [Streptomyces chiangmaiensis]MED7821567.1 MurR/RpiR family transcriptional regulator [Streptomyces chiangmaiensis]
MARQEPPRTPTQHAEDTSPAATLARIRAALPSLAPSERRVAEAVLADPAQAAELSISALGKQAHTSVATVMRFCRAIGLTNYPQLRLALAAAAAHEHALGGERPAPSTDISATDTLGDIVSKIVYNEVRALEDSGAELDIEVLGRAVDAMAGARRIDIFGVGASAFVGQDLHQKLHRIGHFAFIWTDRHAALTAAALLGPGDVALAISHSGETEDTVEPLQAAAERGATTIALTNVPRSTLAASADLVLTTCARETPFRSGATVSRIAQLAVIDCLFVGVAQRSYDATTVALEKTYGAVQRRKRRQPQRHAQAGD